MKVHVDTNNGTGVARIDWGDGTDWTESETGEGGGHTYAIPGTYEINASAPNGDSMTEFDAREAEPAP